MALIGQVARAFRYKVHFWNKNAALLSTHAPCAGLISCVSKRHLQTGFAMNMASDMETDFNHAKDNVNKVKEDPGNEVKLQMYALFKQATVGKCNAPKPGMMDFVSKAKWGAWNDLGDISSNEAKKQYIALVNGLLSAEQAQSAAEPAQAGSSGDRFEEIIADIDGNGVYKITLNRPQKKNAINLLMYEEWIKALSNAAANSQVKIACVTGSGDYYCSGNDLSNFMNVDPSNMAEMAQNGGELLERFVKSFIDFPKPLIGLVNGPAVGVSVTTLGLFDVVYAADTATFHTPFSALGQTPEGCSSVTFPQLMGSGRANEMLIFNKKLTAQEAKERGLVCEIFPKDTFAEQTSALLKEMSSYPPNTMKLSKGVIRGFTTKFLQEVNKRECDQLVERWQSEEFVQAIMSFFQSKSKL